MAMPSSPSKLVSSANLSLSNSSPWRLKVTVEAEPDSDLFLDLAQEESLTFNGPTKRGRKPKESSKRTTPGLGSRKVIVPLKGGDDTAFSEDSLGLDNATGIFGSDDIPGYTMRRPTAPTRNAATPKAIIIPLKGSEQKEKPVKRKGTPARKKVQEIDITTPGEGDSEVVPVTTPKRGRGRPRKSIGDAGHTPKPTSRQKAAELILSDEDMDIDSEPVPSTSAPVVESTSQNMPSPPSSPAQTTPDNHRSLPESAEVIEENNEPEATMMAGEEFSIILPNSSALSSTTRSIGGLTTPRPTPEFEEQRREPSPQVVAVEAPQVKRANSRGRPRKNRTSEPAATEERQQTQAVDNIADDVAALSIQTGPKRRRSLRNIEKINVEKPKQNSGAAIKDRFRELASKPSKPMSTEEEERPQVSLEEVHDMSSFRRFIASEPAKIVPGTYDESTMYFASKRPAPTSSRRRQDRVETATSKAPAPVPPAAEEEEFERIIPDHLLGPAMPIERQQTQEDARATPESDLFWEEGRSVRWHEDVAGGSFSLSSSGINTGAGDKPAPETPTQESTHRLLENEIIVEPFRPNAGRLKDGTLMPLVVTREWTNHYWAALTELAFPETNLALRSKKPMARLHQKESPEDAMAVRKSILKSHPRNKEGHLILSEHDSSVIDAFEERLRREIVGKKRIAGETRRMWGFSRAQIKEALIVLKVSRQRRIEWVMAAGEKLEDWGLA